MITTPSLPIPGDDIGVARGRPADRRIRCFDKDAIAGVGHGGRPAGIGPDLVTLHQAEACRSRCPRPHCRR